MAKLPNSNLDILLVKALTLSRHISHKNVESFLQKSSFDSHCSLIKKLFSNSINFFMKLVFELQWQLHISKMKWFFPLNLYFSLWESKLHFSKWFTTQFWIKKTVDCSVINHGNVSLISRNKRIRGGPEGRMGNPV